MADDESYYDLTLPKEQLLSEIDAMGPPSSPKQALMKQLGWILSGLGFLILFTLFKLPTTHLELAIQGQIDQTLNGMGIRLQAAESHLSLAFGVTYEMKNVEIQQAQMKTPIVLDQVRVSPSLFSLLFGKVGGTLKIKKGESSLSSSFSLDQTNQSIDFDLQKLDLPFITDLVSPAKLKGKGWIGLKGNLSGNFQEPESLEGKVSFSAQDLQLDSQSLFGFNLPKVSIAEGGGSLDFKNKKAVFNQVHLGDKDKTTDDLAIKMTGELVLLKRWDFSQINTKLQLFLSKALFTSIPLLDVLMAPAKQGDQSYIYTFKGTMSQPVLAPGNS